MRKRKLRIDRLIILILAILVFLFIQIKFFPLVCNFVNETINDIVNKETINYENVKEFDFEINSKEYLLIDLETNEALYGKDYDIRIYPASLTKLATLDTLINMEENLDNKSFLTQEQFDLLIKENASVAGLESDVEYSLKDLSYALILPSGADAATAIENYFKSKNLDLIEEMNKRILNLKLNNSSFTNSIGLHDDDLYTSLSDLAIIIYDIYKYYPEYLETMNYELEDGKEMISTLSYLTSDDNIKYLGGKTGYTPISGCNIALIYTVNNHKYLLIMANADGSPYNDYKPHFEDVKLIVDKLYN